MKKLTIYIKELSCFPSEILSILGLIVAQCDIAQRVFSAEGADIGVFPVPAQLIKGRLWSGQRFPKNSAHNPFLPHQTLGLPIGLTAAKIGICEDTLLFCVDGFIKMADELDLITAVRYAATEFQLFLVEYLKAKGESVSGITPTAAELKQKTRFILEEALASKKTPYCFLPELAPIPSSRMNARSFSKLLEGGAAICVSESVSATDGTFRCFIRIEGDVIVVYELYEDISAGTLYLKADKAAYYRYNTLRRQLFPEITQSRNSFYEVPQELMDRLPVVNEKSLIITKAQILVDGSRDSVLEIPED